LERILIETIKQTPHSMEKINEISIKNQIPFCQIEGISILSNFTRESFIRDYLSINKPVVLSDGKFFLVVLFENNI